jgi:hypothetical protein
MQIIWMFIGVVGGLDIKSVSSLNISNICADRIVADMFVSVRVDRDGFSSVQLRTSADGFIVHIQGRIETALMNMPLGE